MERARGTPSERRRSRVQEGFRQAPPTPEGGLLSEDGNLDSRLSVREPTGALADIPGSRRSGAASGSADRMRGRNASPGMAARSTRDSSPLPAGAPPAAADERDLESAVAPAGSISVRTPPLAGGSLPAHAVLARLEAELAQAARREPCPELAAALINELRRHGPRAHVNAAAPAAETNDALMSHVTGAHLQSWFRAQGVTDEQAAALRRAALLSGLANPAGTFLSNALQFIAAPWLAASTHQAWNGAATGLATALASAPLNALQQSAVVTIGESIRDHGGPQVVTDKDHIGDKHFLPDVSRRLEQGIQEFSGLHLEMERLAASHHLDLRALGMEMEAQREARGGARLPAALARLPAESLAALRQHGQRLLAAQKRLHRTQRDFLVTQGAHERQWNGNAWQALPRTLRGPAAGLFSLVGKGATTAGGPIAQTVASLLITAAQHLAAGLDERNKQDYNNRLNLMYGDCLTAEGQARFARGEAIAAADIDLDKLRGFIRFPAQSLVGQVTRELELQRTALREHIDGRIGSSASGEDLARDREALARLEADISHLKRGSLARLSPGGMGESLLVAADGGVLSEALRRQMVRKYTLREFSAQTAQRIGQMFHLGVLGSAAPSATGKVVSAMLGGVKKAPAGVVAGVAAASAVMAAVGARSTHTAIAVKNNRREADPDIGFLAQVGRGVMGGLHEMNAQRRGKRASRAINETLAEERVDATLRFAGLLRDLLGDGELVQTLSLAEAARQLHPGHRSSGAQEIAIEMAPASS
jgi:hypothetical protein